MTMRTRRRLLALACALPGFASYVLERGFLKQTETAEDFVLVRGWLLRKTDLPEYDPDVLRS